MHDQLHHLNKAARLQAVIDAHEAANVLRFPPSLDNDDDDFLTTTTTKKMKKKKKKEEEEEEEEEEGGGGDFSLNTRLKEMLSELEADFVYTQKTAQHKVPEFREAAGLLVP